MSIAYFGFHFHCFINFGNLALIQLEMNKD